MIIKRHNHNFISYCKYNSPRKCNILVITCTVGISLIYMYTLTLGRCVPSDIVRIYQANPSCPCYNLHIYIIRIYYIYIYIHTYIYRGLNRTRLLLMRLAINNFYKATRERLIIGMSLSEPHQILQRFQIIAFQHGRT